MDDIMGISLKRLVATILAVLAMIFLLVDKHKATEPITLLSIMVATYLIITVILAVARKGDMIGASGSVGMECAFAILLFMFDIRQLGEGRSFDGSHDSSHGGLTTAALIMNIIVASIFAISALFM